MNVIFALVLLTIPPINDESLRKVEIETAKVRTLIDLNQCPKVTSCPSCPRYKKSQTCVEPDPCPPIELTCPTYIPPPPVLVLSKWHKIGYVVVPILSLATGMVIGMMIAN